MRTKRVSIAIDAELNRKLKVFCAMREIFIVDVVETAIKTYLEARGDG